jgi:lipopolysaccharide transport system permease protein
LEILPAISLLAALFHSMVSILVLLLASAAIKFYLPWTVILFPIVLLPLIMLILGLSWILASLGGFIRDIGQTIGIITTVMLFLAPVFYPLSAMPEKYHPYIMANPLTFIIEQSREVLIYGHLPMWSIVNLIVFT